MMNKVITGGILVAVTGGIPGATYLLTQERRTTTVSEDKKVTTSDKDLSKARENDGSEEAVLSPTCQTQGVENDCPKGEEEGQ